MSSSSGRRLRYEIPEKFAPLWEAHRYKVLYGGRGAAKSWNVARTLLVMGVKRPLRVLCAREFQNSIDESVHALLASQIVELGLQAHYQVQARTIIGANGTEFVFYGLRHNISKVKSLEAIDVCWVEEAAPVSSSSWETLIPTIRKDASEIWVTFNPELEDDETYQRFVVKTPPDTALIPCSYRDNPWFPDVLKKERDFLRETNVDAYQNIWEGLPREALEEAIFKDQIRAAKAANRIGKVPHVEGRPVDTFWDLGRSDLTSIWFVQRVGFEYRVIDYFQSSGKTLPYYLKELQSRPYVYGPLVMPHDADHELLAAEKTIAGQARAFGFQVRVLPNRPGDVALRIEAARNIFAQCWFDEAKTKDGMDALRHYAYDKDPDTGKVSTKPKHDWASHGADAFGYFAVSTLEPRGKKPATPARKPVFYGTGASGNWMG